MVPILTARGYFRPVASKWRSAEPLPPLPSQLRRPEPMNPVDRLSHRLPVSPVSSQRQSFGSGLMRLPVSN
eukprot:216763-Chlamydomonas_euryale.AAC.2